MKKLIVLLKMLCLTGTVLALSASEVSCEQVLAQNGKVRLIDVRSAEEYHGELGHIDGAELVTLGPELTAALEKGNPKEKIVFVCRSGSRSAKATEESRRLGYENTASMAGGMNRWNQLGYPVVR